jgi:hypothetical protein
VNAPLTYKFDVVLVAVELVVDGVLDVDEIMVEELVEPDELRDELLEVLEVLDELDELDELEELLLLLLLLVELLLEEDRLVVDELDVLLLDATKGPLLQVSAIGAQILF